MDGYFADAVPFGDTALQNKQLNWKKQADALSHNHWVTPAGL